MARNRVKTVEGYLPTQGEGSKIVFLSPTVGEQKHQQKLLKAETESPEVQEKIANDYMANHMLDWNWKDDEDKPLPKPHGNPDVFDLITGDEIQFIARSLAGLSEEDVANRKK